MCKTIPSLCSSSVSLAPLPWDVASLEAWQRWGERRGRAVGANPPQTLTMMRAFSYCPVELYYIIPCWWCPWKKAVRGRHRCLQEGLGAAWCYGGAVHLRVPIIYINYIYTTIQNFTSTKVLTASLLGGVADCLPCHLAQVLAQRRLEVGGGRGGRWESGWVQETLRSLPSPPLFAPPLAP